ncbi:hypothetical protein MASR2M47_11160 [Draconibacterium sp.]
MSTVELRHIITEQLMQIEDESFLNALKTIIDSKVSSGIYKLSDYEKERIHLGREKMKNGETNSNEAVQKEIDKMLNFSFDWEGGLKDIEETSVKLQHKAN